MKMHTVTLCTSVVVSTSFAVDFTELFNEARYLPFYHYANHIHSLPPHCVWYEDVFVESPTPQKQFIEYNDSSFSVFKESLDSSAEQMSCVGVYQTSNNGSFSYQFPKNPGTSWHIVRDSVSRMVLMKHTVPGASNAPTAILELFYGSNTTTPDSMKEIFSTRLHFGHTKDSLAYHRISDTQYAVSGNSFFAQNGESREIAKSGTLTIEMPSDTQFTFHKNLVHTSDAGSVTTSAETYDYLFTSGGKLISEQTDSLFIDYRYDANGNLVELGETDRANGTTARNVTLFSYDSENRLIEQKAPSGFINRYYYSDPVSLNSPVKRTIQSVSILGNGKSITITLNSALSEEFSVKMYTLSGKELPIQMTLTGNSCQVTPSLPAAKGAYLFVIRNGSVEMNEKILFQ